MPAAVFDARAAKAMKAGEIIAFTPEYPGLRLVATDTKRTWTYRYRHPDTGLMKQMKLGAWPALGFSAAVEAWGKARGVRSAGVDVGEQARAGKAAARAEAVAKRAAEVQTCGWLVEEYLVGVVEPQRKAKGAREARRMLERAIDPQKATPARSLSREQAHQIVAAITATAPRVAAMTRQELRGAWAYAIDRGLVDLNPFLGRNLGGAIKANKGERVLSDAEASALLRWWDEPRTYSRTVRDALELVLRTGLRSGEVCEIHTRELHERDGVLWLDIPGERMKFGRPHSAPLLGRARDIVVPRMPASGGFIFPTRQGSAPVQQKVLGVEVYAHSGASKAATYAHLRVCPVNGWTPHDLRRTARTMLSELGCPFEVGEAILAHTLPGVASVYSRAVHVEAKIDWLGRLNNHLDRLR